MPLIISSDATRDEAALIVTWHFLRSFIGFFLGLCIIASSGVVLIATNVWLASAAVAIGLSIIYLSRFEVRFDK